MPTIPTVLETLYAMLADGSMIEHAGATLSRVLFGFSLASAVGNNARHSDGALQARWRISFCRWSAR